MFGSLRSLLALILTVVVVGGAVLVAIDELRDRDPVSGLAAGSVMPPAPARSPSPTAAQGVAGLRFGVRRGCGMR